VIRKRHAFGLSVFVSAVAWACGHDYTSDTSTPIDAGAGIDHATEDVFLSPANPPGITIDRIVVPRGESVTVPFTVTRDGHTGPLTIVASNLPTGVTVGETDVAADATTGHLQVTAATTAAEGTTTLTLDLLEGTSKLASATVVLEVAPLRAGSLDPSFGQNGFVDLGLPQSLVSFADDGTFYVMATTGLARWTKDGVHDLGYGGLQASGSFTLWSMVAANTGAVYFSGYESSGATSKAILLRTTTDGISFDPAFGDTGVAALPPSDAKNANGVAMGVLPNSLIALVKVEHDSTGAPGSFLIARTGLGGTAFGITTFPGIDAGAPEVGFVATSSAGDAYLATSDGANGSLILHMNGAGGLESEEHAGAPTAVGEHFLATQLAPDASALVQTGANAFGTVNTGGPINAIIIDTAGPIVAGCTGGQAAWSRYQADGGADPTYRAQSTAEIACVLTAQATPKYIYIAGLGGVANKLRIARLIR
jgi:hypothetical protein